MSSLPSRSRETRSRPSEVDRIARMGRAFGFRLLTVTQRSAVLHKDVLSQDATPVALRMQAPRGRKAFQAWVEGNVTATLRGRCSTAWATLVREVDPVRPDRCKVATWL